MIANYDQTIIGKISPMIFSSTETIIGEIFPMIVSEKFLPEYLKA